MIEVNGTYDSLKFRPDGDAEVTFRISRTLIGGLMRGIDAVIEAGCPELTITAKKKRKKRSLDANAYFWVLVFQIAEKMQDEKTMVTKEDVYKKYIRAVGVYTPLAVQEKAVDDFIKAWQNNGTGWICEVVDSTLDGCKKVFAYYGSSTYDTKQMSRIIDMAIQDAEALGIETMPPAELESLLQQWGKKDGK